MLASSSSQSKFFSTYSSLKHRQSSLENFKKDKVSKNLRSSFNPNHPFFAGRSVEPETLPKSRKVSNSSKNHKKNTSSLAKYPETSEKNIKSTKTNKSSKKDSKKNSHKRSSSSGFEALAPVIGKNVQKAPKIYDNQIFSDLYDDEGNHDRVLDTSADRKEEGCDFISAELLKLPSVGRNLFNHKKIVF